MDQTILAIDQGTTGSRVFAFDEEGRPRASRYREFRQYYPQPGWVEHDAEEIWEVTAGLIRELLEAEGIGAAGIRAIGITNQRETCVLWDAATGKPLHRAIVWQCRRTAPLCVELEEQGQGALFRERTGLVLDPYFSGTKIRWLLDNVEGAREMAAAGRLRCGTIDTWLIWKLSDGGAFATDYTNASRTLLFNIAERHWDGELCEILDVPLGILPRVLPSASDFGETAAGVVPAGIPIRGVAGDQQAALFGQGCVRPGQAKNTYGTGAFALYHTGDQMMAAPGGLLTTMACAADGGPAYALEGSVFIAGAAMQWLRDGLEILPDVSESAALAASLPDNEGVYLVPAFVGLGAPYWDPHARGALLGLTRGTRRAHVVRAALEAMAYQSRDILETMSRETGLALETLRCDGGAARNDWLMQFQADLLGVPVDIPLNAETTAAGAAYLAGIGAGLWTPEDVQGLVTIDRTFAPRMGDAEAKRLYEGWRRAVAATRAFHPPASS